MPGENLEDESSQVPEKLEPRGESEEAISEETDAPQIEAIQSPEGEKTVGVGKEVKVRDLESNDEWSWRITTTEEADPAEDRISIESPVGRAMSGKKVGEIASVEIPAGTAQYEILEIH